MNPIAAIRKLTGLLAEGERERRYGHDYRQKEAEAQARLETEKLAQVKAKLGIREALAAQDVAGIGDAATLEARGQQGPPNMGDLPPLDPDMAAAAGYDSNAPNLESIRRQAATFKALESKRALEQLKQQGATTRTEITADALRDTANQGHLRPLLRNGQVVGFYNDTTGEFQEGGEAAGLETTRPPQPRVGASSPGAPIWVTGPDGQTQLVFPKLLGPGGVQGLGQPPTADQRNMERYDITVPVHINSIQKALDQVKTLGWGGGLTALVPGTQPYRTVELYSRLVTGLAATAARAMGDNRISDADRAAYAQMHGVANQLAALPPGAHLAQQPPLPSLPLRIASALSGSSEGPVNADAARGTG